MVTAVMIVIANLLCCDAGQAASVEQACRDEAISAEKAAGIPVGLLLAIGKRESGTFDSQSGSKLPWPWTVNVEGTGHFLVSQDAAVTFVREAQASGAQSIDVGCFQINLHYHPLAFGGLDQAFTPAANAAYAAKFLSSLHSSLGSWQAAVGAYHSLDPSRAQPYADGVMSTWLGHDGDILRQAGPRVTVSMHVWGPGKNEILEPSLHGRRLPLVITPVGLIQHVEF